MTTALSIFDEGLVKKQLGMLLQTTVSPKTTELCPFTFDVPKEYGDKYPFFESPAIDLATTLYLFHALIRGL